MSQRRPPILSLRLMTLLLYGLCLLAGARALADAQAPPGVRHAAVIVVDGVIGPAMAGHVLRGLEQARSDGAALVVLRIDTPGGLDASMREIVRAVIASPVPVVGWVAPGGARAASAGTYLLYAGHLAAMSPGTNLGAATPVQLGGGGGGDGGGGGQPGEARPQAASAPASAPASGPRGGTSEAKAVHDAAAYIRSLAELRGRNAEWAERAVRESVSLSAAQALQQRVIDLVATDERDLLNQVHGRTLRLAAGSVTLDTRDLPLRTLEPDWRSRLLGVLGHPNVALILMTIGVYGLLFEFMNPGALIPGVVGGISLLFGLYALSVLPLDYAGAALLLLGLALIVAEAFAPSYGVLGIGGVLAFVFGASLLVDAEVPGHAVSLPLAAGIALAALGFTVIGARLAWGTRGRAQRSGAPAMVGQVARVLDWSQGEGHVFLAGERWSAGGPAVLQPGDRVRVQAVIGLRLQVTLDTAVPPTILHRSPR